MVCRPEDCNRSSCWAQCPLEPCGTPPKGVVLVFTSQRNHCRMQKDVFLFAPLRPAVAHVKVMKSRFALFPLGKSSENHGSDFGLLPGADVLWVICDSPTIIALPKTCCGTVESHRILHRCQTTNGLKLCKQPLVPMAQHSNFVCYGIVTTPDAKGKHLYSPFYVLSVFVFVFSRFDLWPRGGGIGV